MSGLFDQNSGIFGLWRDLDNDVTNGVQSAFVSFEKFLTQVIGPDSIYTELSKLMEALGLSRDPMKMLADGFEWMAGFTKGLVGTIKQFRESINKTTPESAFKWLQGALGGLGGWIAEQYNRFIYWLDKQVKNFDPSSIPSEQISGAIMGFIAGIVDFFNKLDKGKTIQLGMDIIFKLIETIGYVLTHLDPSVYAAVAAVIVGRALFLMAVPVVVGFITSVLGGAMGAIIPAVIGLVTSTILPAIGTAIAGLAATVGIASTGVFGVIVGGIGFLLFRTITTYRMDIINDFEQKLKMFQQVFSGIGELATGIVTLNKDKILSGIGKMFDGINKLFRDVQNKLSILTTGKTQDELDQIAADKKRADALTAKGYSYVVDSDGNERLERNKWTPDGLAQSKYMGHIPAAFGGLLSALSSESRNMPRGAGLAIANTSEAILRPEQLKNLVFGSVAAGAAGMGATFAPQIVINGGGDPQQTAELVMREMERMFGEFTRGQLA